MPGSTLVQTALRNLKVPVNLAGSLNYRPPLPGKKPKFPKWCLLKMIREHRYDLFFRSSNARCP